MRNGLLLKQCMEVFLQVFFKGNIVEFLKIVEIWIGGGCIFFIGKFFVKDLLFWRNYDVNQMMNCD